jgi:hypothetical protein
MIRIEWRMDSNQWEIYEYAEQPAHDISHGFYNTHEEATEELKKLIG